LLLFKVKDTLWEGGVRGAGFIWSPLLKSAPRVSEQMMNVQDWLPTLYQAAGTIFLCKIEVVIQN
jgi:arylsulfatase B